MLFFYSTGRSLTQIKMPCRIANSSHCHYQPHLENQNLKSAITFRKAQFVAIIFYRYGPNRALGQSNRESTALILSIPENGHDLCD